MKRFASFVLSVSCTIGGCSIDAKSHAAHAKLRAPREARFLAQPFRVGEALCKVDDAKERVTELAQVASGQRVSPDVRVLEVSIACASRDGTTLRTSEVLPKDLVILLRVGEGTLSGPSTRTWLSKREPDHVVFELDEGSALLRPRRFDAHTGARKHVEGPSKAAELWLSSASFSVRVMLAYAFEGGDFEQSLDKLARTLGESAAPPSRSWSELSELHHSIIDATRAHTLTITPHEQSAERPLISLSYGGLGRVASFEIPTIWVELEKRANEEPLYQLAGTRDALSVRRAIRCAERSLELEVSTQRAYEGATSDTECNVLGLLWPSACPFVAPEVIQRAALVRSDCALPPLQSLVSRTALVPEDFQLTLRRGRASGPLDRTPRYVVSLFANGAISFHGQHWVGSLGRSDGRTSPRLLGALLRHVSDISWFDRKGGEWNQEGCDPSDDDGHVITVHANDRERMVLDRDGCRGPFSKAELSEVITLVEQVAFVSAWTTQRPEYADRHAKVWTITDD